MRIILINSNTSEFVTVRAINAARTVVSESTVEEGGVNGEFCAPIINNQIDIVVGSRSVVELATKHGN